MFDIFALKMINLNIETVGFFSYTDMKTVSSPYSCLFISPSFFLISGTFPPSRHQMEPIIYTHCSTCARKTTLTSLSPSLLLPDIRSEPIICTCSSTNVLPPFLSIYPSMPALPHFTCLSPLPPSLSFFPLSARYYVQPLSTLILLLQSIHLSSFTSLSTSTSLTSRQSHLLSAPLHPYIMHTLNPQHDQTCIHTQPLSV